MKNILKQNLVEAGSNTGGADGRIVMYKIDMFVTDIFKIFIGLPWPDHHVRPCDSVTHQKNAVQNMAFWGFYSPKVFSKIVEIPSVDI